MLTDVEKACVKDLFDQIDEMTSCAGCNDYTIPRTPANRVFAEEAIRINGAHEGWLQEDIEEDVRSLDKPYRTKYPITDYAVVEFLKHKLGLCKCET